MVFAAHQRHLDPLRLQPMLDDLPGVASGLELDHLPDSHFESHRQQHNRLGLFNGQSIGV